MAVITISRQVAALGDEIADALAKKLGYVFIDRKEIEKRIVDLGFSEEKLKKYDEKKPGFFASLAKDRDEYLDYVQTAILEAASQNNCILIGRGAFSILEGVENVIAVRLIANNDIRKQRLMNEFSWDEKKAMQRIQESDANRIGFHKSFFNVSCEDATMFHSVLNTGILTITIPVTLTEMSYYSFYGTPISDVYYGGSESQWNQIRKTGFGLTNPLSKAIIHYAEEDVEIESETNETEEN